MADFYRLIRLSCFFLVGLIFGGVATYASAETIAASQGVTTVSSGAFVVTWSGATTAQKSELSSFYSSAAGTYSSTTALSTALSSKSTSVPVTGTTCTRNAVTISSTYAMASHVCAGFNAHVRIDFTAGYACPTGQNWTLSGTTCTRPDCVAPQTRQSDGTCSSPCIAGTQSQGAYWTGRFKLLSGAYVGTLNSPPSSMCDGACLGTPVSLQNCYSDTSSTYPRPMWCEFLITLTGDTCTGGKGDAPKSDPCFGQGKVTGTINGVSVCAGDADTGTTSTKQTQTGDGTTTTKESTNCTGDSCTTVKEETTVNPDGTTSTKVETDTQDKTSFCTENPTSPICKIGSYTDNGCTAAPACDGDAVQCAQANYAWKMKCNQETEPDDAAYLLGKSLAEGGADPMGNPLDPANATNFDIGSIVSTAAGQRSLSAHCIPSPSFSALGGTFTLDTTKFCEFAGIVGYLMVACASIIAVRMVAA